MRKIISSLLIVGLSTTYLVPTVGAISVQPTVDSVEKKEIVYPAGDDFVRLKSLIDTNFSKSSKNGYRYSCIADNTLCPNYKYTSVIEKALKLLVAKTYTGNESFYANLFDRSNSYSYGNTTSHSLKDTLSSIPTGTQESDWKALEFGGSDIGTTLLDASFGVSYDQNSNQSGMLGAIESKIKDMKRQKCQKMEDYSSCPWDGNTISNSYLPTPEELSAETVYLNRNDVKIESLKDEFEYQLQYQTGSSSISKPNSDSIIESVNFIENAVPKESRYYTGIVLQYLPLITSGSNTYEENKKIAKSALELIQIDPSISDQSKLSIKEHFLKIIESANTSNTMSNIVGYTLKYKKDTYTLEEAKAFLEKKYQTEPTQGPTVTTTEVVPNSNCTCVDTVNSCTDISTRRYECRINTSSMNQVQENTSSGIVKKDYLALLSGANIPEMPAIFAHVPADSMMLYVKNPQNLIDLLDQKSDTTNRLSGIDVSLSIKKLIQTFFEMENFDKIEKNLQHEMVAVVNNLDATAPDIVIILSEADRDALSPTAKARVVGSKDGFIYVASSKASLERVENLSLELSLKNAPDFKYVWTKKSPLIKDAFVFVGDAFFEKMLTLENYIEHYRKYRDYRNLWSLQELVWAYGDAFGSLPQSFSQIIGIDPTTRTPEISGFSLQNGVVSHNNIGTLVSTRTLPETNYDLSKITRAELEDYKYNVQGYRDIWRASLDPMGIVLNRYGDGMELDFFMTPLPQFDDFSLKQLKQNFAGTMKDSLSFVNNPHIRMGLVSFVLGADTQKVKTRIQSDENMSRSLQMMSSEVLGGKSIFDYLGGEFAFTLGSLDPDIFDGWNVEKADVALAIQVVSEEKGKELIDLIRDSITKQMGGSSMNLEDIARSGGGMAASFLAKPLIEDYNGKKIYYLEGVRTPFLGNISFAYTFIDDFFVLGLNRGTVKKYIDTAASGDNRKKSIMDSTSFEKNTFFATLLDGKSTSDELKKLYDKSKVSLNRISGQITSDSTIESLASTYYVMSDRDKRLGRTPDPLSHTFGGLTLTGDANTLKVHFDEKMITSLTGSALDNWNKAKQSGGIPSSLFGDGTPVDEFLTATGASDVLAMATVTHLDRVFAGQDSLLRNATFGMHLGDDEIGFRLRVFRSATPPSSSVNTLVSHLTKGISSLVWIGLGSILALGVLGGIVWYIIRRRKLIAPPAVYGTSAGEANGDSIVISPLIISETPVMPLAPDSLPSEPVSNPSPSVAVPPTETISPSSSHMESK